MESTRHPSAADADELIRGRVVTTAGIIADGLVAVRGTEIGWVGTVSQWPGKLPPPSPNPLTVIPGLVDLHCHGGGGFGFPEADADGCAAAARHHRSAGTTTMLSSLVSAPAQVLLRRVDLLADMVESGEFAGIHLEGPFLAVRRCGAQDPAAIVDGDPDLLETLLEAGRGAIRAMTLAPETRRFPELVRLLRRYDVVPSLGHTDASSATTTAAIEAALPGPLSATHLFNAMAPLHHRLPGAVGACLAAAGRGQMVVELIGDGEHLADETVSAVFDLVGPGQIALVSDAIAAAGMSDGRYSLGALVVDVVAGVARLVEDPTSSTMPPPLAGSTATLLDVLRRTVIHAGVDLASAVTAASATPARSIGMDAYIGDLAVGLRADLVLLDASLRPTAVMAAGRWIGNTQPTERCHN